MNRVFTDILYFMKLQIVFSTANFVYSVSSKTSKRRYHMYISCPVFATTAPSLSAHWVTATCHHWHVHITRLDRDLMQSEFENVIGVLPKISGGSRGGLGGLQVPRWNPFFPGFFLNVKSTVHPTPNPHSHPPPLSVNPRWRRARSAPENVRSKFNLMPFVFL